MMVLFSNDNYFSLRNIIANMDLQIKYLLSSSQHSTKGTKDQLKTMKEERYIIEKENTGLKEK